MLGATAFRALEEEDRGPGQLGLDPPPIPPHRVYPLLLLGSNGVYHARALRMALEWQWCTALDLQ